MQIIAHLGHPPCTESYAGTWTSISWEMDAQPSTNGRPSRKMDAQLSNLSIAGMDDLDYQGYVTWTDGTNKIHVGDTPSGHHHR